MAEKTRQQFETDTLPRYIETQRWYATKGTPIERVRITEQVLWQEGKVCWLVALVELDATEPRASYFLPLGLAWEEREDERAKNLSTSAVAKIRQQANVGVMGDAFADELFCRAVVAAMAARRWRGAVLPAVAVPLAAALTELALKPLFGRTIGGALSYPSGHATSDFALATVAAILFAGPARPRIPAFARRLLLLGAFLFAAVVAVAMVGLWYHYFTDIIGGAAVGSGTVVLTALVLTALPVPRLADRSACADHRWAPWLRRHWL